MWNSRWLCRKIDASSPFSQIRSFWERCVSRKSVAHGLTNKEIAAHLGIAERTAETHVQRIVTKLDLRSRTEAMLVAARMGLTSG